MIRGLDYLYTISPCPLPLHPIAPRVRCPCERHFITPIRSPRLRDKDLVGNTAIKSLITSSLPCRRLPRTTISAFSVLVLIDS